MNKKTNYVLYLIAATIVSLLLIVGIFIVLLLLYQATIGRVVSTTVTSVFLIFDAFGSVALSMIIQNFILRKFAERVDLDKYFDPGVARSFFSKRRPGKGPNQESNESKSESGKTE